MPLGNFKPRPAVIVPPTVVKDVPQLPPGVVDTAELGGIVATEWQPEVAQVEPKRIGRHFRNELGGRGVVRRRTPCVLPTTK